MESPPVTREVHVTGVSEQSCRADRATLSIKITNSKDSVNDVSTSISRRLEYIQQTLRQNGVRDAEVTVGKYLHREEHMYQMDAEVTVDFTDFEKMDEVCCILLEKLDWSVVIEAPRFYHSAQCMKKLRLQACVTAVESAREKAKDLSYSLGQHLGDPLLVREEEAREWKNGREEEEEGVKRHKAASTQHPALRGPTVTAFSRVSVSFKLLNRNGL